MTIIVSVKINDGLVVASDSTTSFFRADEKFVQSYDNANKIFNLRKGLPIGAMTCGVGGIGSASISTLSKDLRRRFSGEEAECVDWELDAATYTVKDVAEKARAFLFELTQAAGANVWLTYWVFGYSAGHPLPEIWSLSINGADCPPLTLVRDESSWGPNWAGEEEALDRLILGRSSAILDSLVKNGMDENAAKEIVPKVVHDLYETLVLPAMPIQDAIDLAKYLVETTMGFFQVLYRSGKNCRRPHRNCRHYQT